MRKVAKGIVGGFFSILLCTSLVMAEEEEQATELKEVVVTATKTKKTIEEAPASVTVVTKENLKRKNYVNLNEALETIEGVFSLSQPYPISSAFSPNFT